MAGNGQAPILKTAMGMAANERKERKESKIGGKTPGRTARFAGERLIFHTLLFFALFAFFCGYSIHGFWVILETAMEVTADYTDYADYAEEEGLGFLQRILL